MSRVTRKVLESQLRTLNSVLGRPSQQFTEAGKFSIGYIAVEHSGYGYSIEEQSSESGGVNNLGSGLTANEAYWLLRGMLHGVALKNKQLQEA